MLTMASNTDSHPSSPITSVITPTIALISVITPVFAECYIQINTTRICNQPKAGMQFWGSKNKHPPHLTYSFMGPPWVQQPPEMYSTICQETHFLIKYTRTMPCPPALPMKGWPRRSIYKPSTKGKVKRLVRIFPSASYNNSSQVGWGLDISKTVAHFKFPDLKIGTSDFTGAVPKLHQTLKNCQYGGKSVRVLH